MVDRAIASRLAQFRSAHDFPAAWAYLRALAPSAGLSATELAMLRWYHQPLWWQDRIARGCILSRRRPRDMVFIRQAWADAEFKRRFHRLAAPLPAADDDLHRILEREFTSTVPETRALHWTILDGGRVPRGLLSLTDISPMHRRAEALIGILPGAPFAMSSRAMLMLFDFFFGAIGYNKLYTFIYPDNEASMKATLHLGFRQEGYLREHIRDPESGGFFDLIQTGITRAEAMNERYVRLRQRLFS